MSPAALSLVELVIGIAFGVMLYQAGYSFNRDANGRRLRPLWVGVLLAVGSLVCCVAMSMVLVVWGGSITR